MSRRPAPTYPIINGPMRYFFLESNGQEVYISSYPFPQNPPERTASMS